MPTGPHIKNIVLNEPSNHILAVLSCTRDWQQELGLETHCLRITDKKCQDSVCWIGVLNFEALMQLSFQMELFRFRPAC